MPKKTAITDGMQGLALCSQSHYEQSRNRVQPSSCNLAISIIESPLTLSTSDLFQPYLCKHLSSFKAKRERSERSKTLSISKTRLRGKRCHQGESSKHGSTDEDSEDGGMGERSRQTDDGEEGGQALLGAIEEERLLEPVSAAPTELVEQEVVQFSGTPDTGLAETVAELDNRIDSVKETQEPEAIGLDEGETSSDTYIYDTSPQISQPPEVGDSLEAARQKLRQNRTQELSDGDRQLLQGYYRTVYENLKDRVNNQLTGQECDRAVVKLAIYSGRYTNSELVAIADMGDYAKSILQELGKEKVREETVLLVKEVKKAASYSSKKKRQTDLER